LAHIERFNEIELLKDSSSLTENSRDLDPLIDYIGDVLLGEASIPMNIKHLRAKKSHNV
jgi:hypothetical protein